jgi:phosphatidylserine decarboxylase
MIVIESPVGFVAVLAVGMGHVSSVNITADEGIGLAKGEEFGYFTFGGSDMVMLFEANRVAFIAQEGVHYKQGEEIARAVK